MRECPQCKSVYSDDSLRYCLTDGTELTDQDPTRTVEMRQGDTASSSTGSGTDGARVRIDVPQDDEAETLRAAKFRPTEKKKGVSKGIVSAIVGLLLIVIVALGSFIAYILYQQNKNSNEQNKAAVSNSKDAEVERLKHRIDELGNRLSSDVSEATPTPTVTATPGTDIPEFDDEVIKRVNSPTDGFLALRDRPDAASGNRVAKIPHGDTVVLGKCQDKEVTIGKRTGHWCRAKWEGYSGWIFDVWLID